MLQYVRQAAVLTGKTVLSEFSSNECPFHTTTSTSISLF